MQCHTWQSALGFGRRPAFLCTVVPPREGSWSREGRTRRTCRLPSTVMSRRSFSVPRHWSSTRCESSLISTAWIWGGSSGRPASNALTSLMPMDRYHACMDARHTSRSRQNRSGLDKQDGNKRASSRNLEETESSRTYRFEGLDGGSAARPSSCTTIHCPLKYDAKRYSRPKFRSARAGIRPSVPSSRGYCMIKLCER